MSSHYSPENNLIIPKIQYENFGRLVSQPTNNASGVVYATPTNAAYKATNDATLTASIVVASVV